MAGAPELSRPWVEYTAPLPLVARSVAWLAGSSSVTTTSTSSTARAHSTRDGRNP